MKKKVSPWNYPILALVLALGWAGSAAAQDLSSFYVTPKIMTSYQKADFSGNGGSERSAVFGLGVSVGTDLSYSSSLPVRMEIEYLYHGNQTFNHASTAGTGSNDVSAHSFLANAFIDISTDTAFTPYVGAGLGMACLNNRVVVTPTGNGSTNTKTSRWNFAWNLGGGVAWSINESLALDLGYRYMDLGKTQNVTSGALTTGVELTAHEFALGVRIMSF